ncbi:MAG: capsular polysaccharide biosynthesis protein CapF [Lachnospiraceae bacterium]|nr:capsular polysaccharide biosynthesis protein CapF [Lachnospiraceae bacterium]
MKILVTGAKGFVGKNLIAELKNRKYDDIFEYDLDTKPSLLDEYVRECDFVFHLAGVNRPKDESEFMTGNFGFTDTLLSKLKEAGNKAPVLITSSIQASLDNPYGKSKKAGEDLMFSYSKETGAGVFVYRLPNVFGKWCRPNYNSAVATFCNNIAAGLPIKVNDPSVVMNLVYIDDVVCEFINAMEGRANIVDGFGTVPVTHTVTLGRIVEIITSFKENRKKLELPKLDDEFERKLYSTYLSYLPSDDFAYPLKMNTDERGSFTEFIRTPDRGQVSVNISHPGITKGNHWHHSKNEKFLVVKGRGLISFRKYGTDEIIDYHVSGDELTVVDIPTGYTHSITNEGDEDMVTVMWANEAFNPDKPDTFYEPVIRE